jgi:hypothetical protein
MIHIVTARLEGLVVLTCNFSRDCIALIGMFTECSDVSQKAIIFILAAVRT